MSEQHKRVAGIAAAELVEDGMRVGLGTGSTAAHAIRRIGERVQQGLRILAIPTSVASQRLAEACGIELTDFAATPTLDLTIDGADEIDPDLQLIKGGGGALLREKVVASRSDRVVIIADPSKLVSRLGTTFALPVEVVPFAWPALVPQLRQLGGRPALRNSGTGPFVTDNGNYILDLTFADGIDHPANLERALDAIPGIVESGLFVGLAHTLVVGRDAGAEITDRP